ncbi:MAG: cytochrome P450 [Leptospiraceae bacterium]|nr:cytochrome P450 [Leptospiraceae bacterium]
MASELLKIANISDVLEGQVLAINVEGVDLILLQESGIFYIFQGLCPHKNATLATGTLIGKNLKCSLHGWEYDISSGKKVGTDNICLTSFPYEIKGEEIFIISHSLQKWRDLQTQLTFVPKESYKNIKSLPAVPGNFFTGNISKLKFTTLHKTLEDWSSQYNGIFTIRLLRKTAIVLSDPELIQEVLKNRPEYFRRTSKLDSCLKDMGIQGVFTAEGDSWRRQRQYVMSALSPVRVKGFLNQMSVIAKRMILRWSNLKDQSIEIQKEFMRFTVDITTNFAFGYDMNTIEKETDPLQKKLEIVFPMLAKRLNSIFPYWKYIKFSEDRKLDKTLSEIKKIVQEFTEAARTRLKENPSLMSSPQNFLETILAKNETEGSQVTDHEIMSNVMTLLLAGEDTTANTLAWIMYYITKYPKIQNKIREEVNLIFQDTESFNSIEKLEKLKYLEAVTMETLRLKPVAPMMLLESKKDYVLNSVFIPAGTIFFLSLSYAGKLEENFTNALEFDPERWLRSVKPSEKHNANHTMPFGSGPRFCPGRNLALTEIKLLLSMLINQFHFSRDMDKKVTENLAFTLQPQNLWIGIQKI